MNHREWTRRDLELEIAAAAFLVKHVDADSMSEEHPDPLEQALATDVIACIYGHPDEMFGHGWAVEYVDGKPRCRSCVEWLKRQGAYHQHPPTEGDT